MTPDQWHPFKQKPRKRNNRRQRESNAQLIRAMHDRLVAQGATVRVLRNPKVIDP